MNKGPIYSPAGEKA